jgi:hypothetical protein
MRSVAPPSLLFSRTPRTHHVSRGASCTWIRGGTAGRVRLATQATFAELLIDCEEDKTLWAVLVRMPREADRQSSSWAPREPGPHGEPAV